MISHTVGCGLHVPFKLALYNVSSQSPNKNSYKKLISYLDLALEDPELIVITVNFCNVLKSLKTHVQRHKRWLRSSSHLLQHTECVNDLVKLNLVKHGAQLIFSGPEFVFAKFWEVLENPSGSQF